MDEITFLQKLSEASESVSCEVGDIRPSVWRRIGAMEKFDSVARKPFLFSMQELMLLRKLDMAAVFVILIGLGLLHSTLSSLVSDVIWSNAFYSIHNYF